MPHFEELMKFLRAKNMTLAPDLRLIYLRAQFHQRLIQDDDLGEAVKLLDVDSIVEAVRGWRSAAAAAEPPASTPAQGPPQAGPTDDEADELEEGEVGERQKKKPRRGTRSAKTARAIQLPPPESAAEELHTIVLRPLRLYLHRLPGENS